MYPHSDWECGKTILVETTGGDSTPRTNSRHRVSIVIFLRLAKGILFHHFRLQVCTGKRGDVTHLDDCRGVNSVLCKT